jgi:peroxiredoxin
MTPYIREAFYARIKREEYLVEYVKSRKQVVVGAEAPDFTLKDDKGKSFTLSSLRGKYVVLDFWGSWCTWCIKGFPDMIKAQEKSKDYVAFVSIACRDEKRPEAWKKILEKYQLKWTQLINDDSDLKNDVISRYGLFVYPTKIIIDPQGKIIFHQEGESQDLYHSLDILLDELKKNKHR